jgi:dipeptidase
MDNVATSIYVPIYACSTDLIEEYKTPGRTNGYTLKSAWWIFNRLGTLTAQRWGDAHKDVEAVWGPVQNRMIEEQKTIDEKALELYRKKPEKAVDFLTKYSMEQAKNVMNKGIELGDFIWTKYDEKF